MNRTIVNCMWCWIVALTVILAGPLTLGVALAQPEPELEDDATTGLFDEDTAEDESDAISQIEIKPYTGPPIYLDEPEPQPPARVVERKSVRDTYEDGTPQREYSVARYSDESYVTNGPFREYHPNGQLFVEGTYNNGRQDGEWTYYYDNGQVNRKITLESGKPQGQWEVYRADGAPLAKRSFDQGFRDGEWIYYDETGTQPVREEHYSHGVPDGVWKSWYPSGQLQREVTFAEGLRQGTAKEWTEEGTLKAELNYEKGLLDGEISLTRSDGRKIIQVYENGRLVEDRTQ